MDELVGGRSITANGTGFLLHYFFCLKLSLFGKENVLLLLGGVS